MFCFLFAVYFKCSQLTSMKFTLNHFINYHLRFNVYFKQHLKKILLQKQWDVKRLRDYQNALFLSLFRRAFQKSAFYQNLYAEYGIRQSDIRSVDDIDKLPVVTKHEVRENLKDIYLGNPIFKAVGRTSGSSGTPLKVYRDYASIVKEGAYIWAQRALFGFHPGMKCVSLRGNLDRHVMKREDRVANCLYLSSFNLREENARWYFEQISKYRPYAILAYPSSVEILANFFKTMNLELEVPYIFTSSEQVYEHQRTKVEQVFNTKIIDWYGNAERSIALEQRKDSAYYELPLYSINEYRDDHILTTGLICSAFPLIRYRVDDVIVPSKDHNSLMIEAIEGRHDDVLVLPDGTRVGRIGAVFLDIPGLELAQIRQSSAEHFTMYLVTNNAFNKDSLHKIRAYLVDKAGYELNYDIIYAKPEDIIRTQAGKFKLVISEISPS